MPLSKIQNIYVCSNCDAQSTKWSGRCLECGAWGTLQRQTIDGQKANLASVQVSPAEIISLTKIAEGSEQRLKIGLAEIDRVLGGGLVRGSLILLSGEPGVGKSTIVAQIADAVGQEGDLRVIYASGEESAAQIKARLERLKCDPKKIEFISETNTEKIISSLIKNQPKLVIIDSIQTVYSSLVPSEAGSINQIRASATKFLEIAKANDMAIILVGHITKDGQIAGPKSLEHIVDTVIYLESETTHNYRVLRVTKNRFGSINELGIFEMTDSGFKEVKNPSAVFLEASDQKITGSVISCIIEGTRPFLIEIQALVTKTVFGYPQRKTSGFDLNRLQVLTAVLTKRAQVNLTNQDVILNVVGGLKINDPSLDLAVCLAITSSLLNQVIDRKTLAIGEVGLGGEVRKVAKLQERLKEAKKLGFTSAIVPDCDIKVKEIKLLKFKNLDDIVKNLIKNLMYILPLSFYSRPALKVAQDLLGCFLVRTSPRLATLGTPPLPALSDGVKIRRGDGGEVRRGTGRGLAKYKIVEVEAYNGPNDLASHASQGKTPRNEVMFGSAGIIYVYFTYGMHYMLNIVTGPKDYPAAVLIRAVEPRLSRGAGQALKTNGPGKLTKSLGIDKKFNGRFICIKKHGLWIEDRGEALKTAQIKKTTRIGVDYARGYRDKKWRFYIRGNEFVSRK